MRSLPCTTVCCLNADLISPVGSVASGGRAVQATQRGRSVYEQSRARWTSIQVVVLVLVRAVYTAAFVQRISASKSY